MGQIVVYADDINRFTSENLYETRPGNENNWSKNKWESDQSEDEEHKA